MPKFIVQAYETVFYEIPVEAETKEEAIRLVDMGMLDGLYPDAYDGENFTVTSADEASSWDDGLTFLKKIVE